MVAQLLVQRRQLRVERIDHGQRDGDLLAERDRPSTRASWPPGCVGRAELVAAGEDAFVIELVEAQAMDLQTMAALLA